MWLQSTKSTASAAIIIQSVIVRAVDSNNFVLMVSVDFSAAFDFVNNKLLMKWLTLIGLPKENSGSHSTHSLSTLMMIIYMKCGTNLGSIFGPILYAIYISLLFDFLKITNLGNDNFVIRCNRSMTTLITNIEKYFEII